MKVLGCITILGICKTICNVDNIKMNEKIVYLPIMLLFGQMALMIQTWVRTGSLGYPNMDVLVSGQTQAPKQTTGVLVHLIFITHAFII